MKINLVTMSTGKYDYFLESFISSAKRHLIGLNDVYVLSDKQLNPAFEANWLPWGFFPWPLSTFFRYQAFSLYSDRSNLFECELVLYADVDMLFVGEVTLPETRGLIAVSHPGYIGKSYESLPFEKNLDNPFYVPKTIDSRYFAGGVQGGFAKKYLETCNKLAVATSDAARNNQIPVWHDESAWNHYLAINPPEVVLSRDYCSPEPEANDKSRILALDKDHAFFRGEKPKRRLWR